MKKIHLIRHAKSSWENAFLTDIDRPLNPRGIRTCQFMAAEIFAAGCRFENVFCSPALRAQATIELLDKHLSSVRIQWQTDERLYSFNSRDLHQWFSSLDEVMSEVVIIGHNPTFTDFCNELAINSKIENIPTCGYVQLVTEMEDTWKEVSNASFEVVTFLRPKQCLKSNTLKN